MYKILIQGERGSFHHEAALKSFGDNIEIIPCSTFHQVFESLDQDNFGLVAIENSLHGSINEVYDLLEKSHAEIFAETELSIHQNLIGLENAKITDLKEVYSHPVALAQCEGFLEKNLPFVEKIEFEDTAAAVRHITELSDPTIAAIASESAARLYGAKILSSEIEDNAINFTRFIAITKYTQNIEKLKSISPHNKSSIILTTNHKPGALYEALGIFVAHQSNLTKLQSRPVIGEKWRYRFYLDFETPANQTNAIISELEALGNNVVLLGSY